MGMSPLGAPDHRFSAVPPGYPFNGPPGREEENIGRFFRRRNRGGGCARLGLGAALPVG